MHPVRQRLARSVEEAVVRAKESGDLPAASALLPATVEHPQNPEHGDYATGLALRLARSAGQKPLTIAEKIVASLPALPEVGKVTVAPPGFINFTLSDNWLKGQVEVILREGGSYGNLDLGQGSPVQVEFVSVNPTGPVHIGHARSAVLGSTLSDVLAAAGYRVTREYYVNDSGSQLEAFSRSLYARYQQALGADAPMPENGYFGGYVADLAHQIIAEYGDRFLRQEDGLKEIGEIGIERMVGAIKADLEALRVAFEAWFRERDLFRNGQYDRVMEILNSKGCLVRKEGATWFVSADEDKDNVLVRSDGSPTYFASDIAYHYNKFIERGFDRVINIWGADHQGHVARMKAAVRALDIDPGRLTILITQLVTLKRGDEVVRVSKRSGDIITLAEVISEVGVDACRFFLLARSADSQMDFDLELAKKQSLDNPVYYVQYGHARIASILRLAEEKGIDYSSGDVSLLSTEPELALIRKLVMLPEVIETAATLLEPHHLPYYAQELATIFHSFYMQCRVVSDDQALTRARLKLVVAARIALARVLGLMGMTAPDRM